MPKLTERWRTPGLLILDALAAGPATPSEVHKAYKELLHAENNTRPRSAQLRGHGYPVTVRYFLLLETMGVIHRTEETRPVDPRYAHLRRFAGGQKTDAVQVVFEMAITGQVPEWATGLAVSWSDFAQMTAARPWAMREAAMGLAPLPEAAEVEVRETPVPIEVPIAPRPARAPKAPKVPKKPKGPWDHLSSAVNLEAAARSFIPRIASLQDVPNKDLLGALEQDMTSFFDRVLEVQERSREPEQRERLETLAARLETTASYFEEARTALARAKGIAYRKALEALKDCCR